MFKRKATQAALNKESGYSLVEMVVAIGMSTVLGLAATGVVVWTINIGARAQVNMIQSEKSQVVLTNFESTVQDADKIVSGTASTLSYTFQRYTHCEYHTYTFATLSGITSLTHTIRAATLLPGQYCFNVATALIAGTVGTQTSSVEATNLDPSSGFDYWSINGIRAYRLGESGYDITTLDPVCLIGSVTINLVTQGQNLNRGVALKTETITANVRQNSFGMTC